MKREAKLTVAQRLRLEAEPSMDELTIGWHWALLRDGLVGSLEWVDASTSTGWHRLRAVLFVQQSVAFVATSYARSCHPETRAEDLSVWNAFSMDGWRLYTGSHSWLKNPRRRNEVFGCIRRTLPQAVLRTPRWVDIRMATDKVEPGFPPYVSEPAQTGLGLVSSLHPRAPQLSCAVPYG